MVKAGTCECIDKTYPSTLSQAVEAKLVCNLGGVHGILKIGTLAREDMAVSYAH